MGPGPASPVSFVVDVRRLPAKGFPVSIDADADARAALAQIHGLVAVDSYRVELVVRAWKRDGIKVVGTVQADIVQECIVTLEPIRDRIEEEIEATFVPEGSPLAKPQTGEGELFLAADGPDTPEEFDGDSIDVGALAEEYFALGIDPYPRKQGAALPGDASAGTVSPFAVLASKIRKD